jgi:mannose-6-phosphate isomerase-like protein (cupin superfamily)
VRRETDTRPWGFWEIIEQGGRHQVKRLIVKPGEATSLQRHHHRAEIWVVVRGAAAITLGDASHMLAEGDALRCPAGMAHRIANPGLIDLEIIETQLGSYLGEDDIVRLADKYGRANA